MAYLPTEGRLAKGLRVTAPITVEVTYADGRVDEHTLEWGRDTCAQINHGC